jgi:hypothetical protein
VLRSSTINKIIIFNKKNPVGALYVEIVKAGKVQILRCNTMSELIRCKKLLNIAPYISLMKLQFDSAYHIQTIAYYKILNWFKCPMIFPL